MLAHIKKPIMAGKGWDMAEVVFWILVTLGLVLSLF
jgi:hypothetical protein